MDEGILNELLECSVCLERLDSSSKVLPCQHTFCKRCLEEIVTSRNELRCPECRILVETKISDLPNNFLLIRLLEGIKSNPRINKNDGNNSCMSSPHHEKQGNQNAGNSDPHKPTTELNSRKSLNETSSRKEIVQPHPCARALYSYDAKEPGDLSFKKGDIIMLKKKIDQNWYHGELGNKHGFFPVTYVQIITPLPNHLPQAKALYDFTCHEGDEKDCLTFKKGNIITVIRRVDENWVEGKLFDKIGIFPITFVEMNSAARAIVKLSASLKTGPAREPPPAPQQQPVVLSPTPSHIIPTSKSSEVSNTTSFNQSSDNNDVLTQSQPQSSSRSDATPITTNSQILSLSSPDINFVSTSVIPQPLPQPPSHPRHLIHRQQREKRHTVSSSPATITSTRHSTSSALQSDHRHSMDASYMLSPINIPSHIARPRAGSHPVHEHKGIKNLSTVSASITTATTTTSTCAITSSSEAILESGPCYLVRRHSTNRREKNANVNHSRQHSAPDPTSLPSSSGHTSHGQTSVLYVAMYSYKPQKEDELELKKSEFYTVSEKCLDGWYKGTSLRTGQTGVFPGNYVQLSKSSIHQGNLHQTSHANVKNTSKALPTQPNAQNSEQCSTSQRAIPSIPSTSTTHSKMSTSIKSPPPRPPRPVVPAESSETANTSPWVAKSEMKTHLPQPPKMTVALPPHVTQSSAATASSIPVPVQASAHGKAVCCTTSSQSWHGAILSTSKSMMSTATTVTPPNISVSSCSSKSTPSKTDKTPKDKKEKERVSDVLKRLTGVKKKSKSPPPTTFSMDNPNFIDVCGIGSSTVHVRSGSCPNDNSSSTSHKKTTSGETAHAHSNTGANTPRPKQPAPLVRERFRCIVPYPPNSDYELELKVGDIIYVHKKRDDGWYKGTLQRTGLTGLFPSSFVESY